MKTGKNLYSHPKRNPSYKDCMDVCARCGRQGGDHFTDEKGISWCFDPTTRFSRREAEAPHLYTSFAYPAGEPENKTEAKDNPNSAFKRRKQWRPRTKIATKLSF